MHYVMYAFLAIAVFLAVLNTFGRGAMKVHLSATLNLVSLGLIVAVFIVAGWKSGVFAITLAAVCAVVSRPVAARVGSRLFSFTDSGPHGRYVGLPPRVLERVSQQLVGHGDDIFRDLDRHKRAEDALLDLCEAQPETRAIMAEYQISREDLRRLYGQLVLAGAGQWTCGHFVAASSIAYPQSLRYLLVRREADEAETAYNLIMYFERGTPLDA